MTQTDTDKVRQGHPRPLGSRISGLKVCPGCQVRLGPLDIPCHGYRVNKQGGR